jgi:hypothetical protein
MSDVNEPQPDKLAESGQQPTPGLESGDTTPAAYAAGGAPAVAAPVGEIRETSICILLTIVTLGFYTWYWYYKTHEEMKQHTGTGIGGPVALILAVLVGFVMPFFSSHEVGGLYERRGEARPVSAVTGLWALLLGWFFFVGLIVWFVKTNGALNDYWRSVGVRSEH